MVHTIVVGMGSVTTSLDCVSVTHAMWALRARIKFWDKPIVVSPRNPAQRCVVDMAIVIRRLASVHALWDTVDWIAARMLVLVTARHMANAMLQQDSVNVTQIIMALIAPRDHVQLNAQSPKVLVTRRLGHVFARMDSQELTVRKLSAKIIAMDVVFATPSQGLANAQSRMAA